MTAAPGVPFRQVNAVPHSAAITGAVLALAIPAALMLIGGTDGLLPVALALIAVFVLGWVFSALTIEVDEEAVRWHFRRGWFAGMLPMRELREAESVDLGWTKGFGYRWTPQGPLYRAWGITCVRLHKETGKPVNLGTPDAIALIAAIEAAQEKWLERLNPDPGLQRQATL